MSKRRFVGVMLAALAVVLAGAALASNMGFKLNYTLIAAGNPVPVPENTVNPNSQDGTNELALPDFRQTGLGTAKQLLTDVGTAAGSISKFLRGNNSLCTYTAAKPFACTTDFALNKGEGYRLKVNGSTNVQYIVVGSQDPTTPTVSFIAAGQPVPPPENAVNPNSQDGTNTYAYEYNSNLAVSAKTLLNEIGTNAGSVSKLLRGNNALCTYTAAKPFACTSDFALTVGESYRVKVNGAANVDYSPSHY